MVSAGITFWCDIESAYGTCPQRVSFATTDLAAATEAARSAGWTVGSEQDRCALYHPPRPVRPPRITGHAPACVPGR